MYKISIHYKITKRTTTGEGRGKEVNGEGGILIGGSGAFDGGMIESISTLEESKQWAYMYIYSNEK